jgi:predicted TIM-barrel fold metal-dependent hydrolase
MLDDERFGTPFIERVRSLGLRTIAVHKGLPFGPRGMPYSLAQDIGPAARRHPDMTFLVYHSGFDPSVREGPYDPRATAGVDVLIRSMREAGRPPNVYAELGSTWRYVMRDPDQAAHLLGKLLLAFGEDRILWGTDSIWYGSPQDQIQAFRTFQIAPALQDRHGYAPLTPALRRKVFGLNAARVYGIRPDAMRARLSKDPVQRRRSEYLHDPQPSFATYGPRTWREFVALRRMQGGVP